MANTKTVVIWDTCDADVKFFVVDGDVTHLNHKYCNSSNVSEADGDEISNLVYDEDGKQVRKFLSEFPTQAVLDGAAVIVCGFLP